MLSDRGIDAILLFVDKTGAVIVTRSMTEEELIRLDGLLLEWVADQTQVNEKRIIDEFVLDAPIAADL